MLTFDGITQPINEWALDYGIYPAVISDRLARGWTIARAITKPMIVAPAQRLTSKHMPGLPASSEDYRTARRKRVAPRKPYGKRLSHAGRCLTVREWSEVLGVCTHTIDRRIRVGWPVERVLVGRQLAGRPGVVPNLPALEGTGGGSFAQDISEIEISP